MTNIEALLTRFWIIKKQDPELYYSIKDEAKTLRKYFLDAFGYSLIVHSDFIRLDKIPGKAEPWMGLQDLKSVEEYQLFCYILMFLEEKDKEEQFVLSNLCEYIQIQLKENEEYWNRFTCRKQLVNVIRFCVKEYLLIQDDGQVDSFTQNEDTEVLFENTGLSRYFMRSFTYNVFDKQEISDFLKDEWERKEDRGNARKHRIYRRLLLSIGIYEENKDLDDFDYIRRFRKSINKDFQMIAPFDLQVQKSSAYLTLSDEIHFGNEFPTGNTLDELMILFFAYLRKRVKNSDILKDEQELIYLKKSYVLNTIKNITKQNLDYLPALYRNKKIEIVADDVYDRILNYGFAWQNEDQIVFAPSISKWKGYYKGEEHAGK